MKFAGVVFGRRITFALARHDVQHSRAGYLLQITNQREQVVQVMSVDGSEIGKSKFFEQRARRHHTLDVFLGALGQFPGAWNSLQYLLAAGAQARINLARPDA